MHGEVKPQNVRLAADGKVKLHVFNLVKSADEINAAMANQTFDAAVLPYLPLEQIHRVRPVRMPRHLDAFECGCGHWFKDKIF